MNQQSKQQPMNKNKTRILGVAALVLLSGLLTGCARPGDESMAERLAEKYACKDMEVVEFVRTDSLPGIYSFVAQYTFQYRFKEGEAGAKKFYKAVFERLDLKGDDWEAAVKSKKMQDYLAEECASDAQPLMEKLVYMMSPQFEAKKEALRLPTILMMDGWSEFMPGRRGWDITKGRDRIVGEPVFSEPVKRELLLSKNGGASQKDKKK